jgi:hypothetical protein
MNVNGVILGLKRKKCYRGMKRYYLAYEQMKTVMLIESALAYINPKEQWEI